MNKVIKALFVAAVVTYPFLLITEAFFSNAYGFNILSSTDWNKVFVFWNSGGVIKTSADYLFLLSIAINPLVLLTLIRFFYKRNLVSILLYPINKLGDIMAERHSGQTKRIKLKNLCRSQSKKDMLDEIKPNIDASKKASQSIRDAVREKLTNN